MIKISIKWLGVLAALNLAHLASANTVEVVPGEFIVRTRPMGEASIQSMKSRIEAHGLRVTQTLNASENLFLVKVVNQAAAQKSLGITTTNFQDAANRISELSDFDRVEPNLVWHALMGSKPPVDQPPPTPPAGSPNDTLFGNLWGFVNFGQKDSSGRAGTKGADASILKAWDLAKGSKNVVVAIIDTGVDYTHSDLKDNIWSMPGNPSVHGYNAITGALDPMDDNMHGTHCSGTIGATGNNGIGVAGVNWSVSIMGSKFLDKNGSGSTSDAIKAIDWAREHGANVMSNSWGGGGYSAALEDAIKRAESAGITFVAAAGNATSDNDSTPSYPASYRMSNVVVVAASNNVDALSSFSNFGAKTVHVLAPGENIQSTVPGNAYKYLSGTSMATPHVTGAVALLLSREPSLTPAQIRDRLISSSDKIPAAAGKAVGGRLNVYKLLSGK